MFNLVSDDLAPWCSEYNPLRRSLATLGVLFGVRSFLKAEGPLHTTLQGLSTRQVGICWTVEFADRRKRSLVCSSPELRLLGNRIAASFRTSSNVSNSLDTSPVG
jgi:hypothetical protein